MNIIEDAVNKANANYGKGGMGIFDETDEVVRKFSAAARSEKFSQANSEANREWRDQELERIAAESMLPGGECYPWSDENFDDIMAAVSNGLINGSELRGKILLEAERIADIVALKNYKD